MCLWMFLIQPIHFLKFMGKYQLNVPINKVLSKQKKCTVFLCLTM